jgi:hypothetical protein
MAQCYTGLLPFLAVQEASQWDLRSLFYVYHSVVLFVFLFVVVVPVVQILRRTGHNPVWCLLALTPAPDAAFPTYGVRLPAFRGWASNTAPALPTRVSNIAPSIP